MKHIKHLFFISLFVFAITANLASQTLEVPGTYGTIQAAIEAAQKGDTVLVSPGRYIENINFRGKSIVVASKYLTTADTSYISSTIIDGSSPLHADSASCVMLISSEDSCAILDGFTLTGGTGTPIHGFVEGGGVLMDSSQGVIRNNIIVSNVVPTGGGGIASWYGNPTILNNIIANNTAGYAAGLVLNWSDGIVKNNIIYHNKKVGSKWLTGGLMVWDSPGQPIIENNTIVGNTSNTTAGGVSITPLSNPMLINNIIWGNRQPSGLQVTGVKTNMLTYCDVENTISGEGNLSTFPMFNDASLTLAAGSPCIDTGNVNSVYNDKENSLSPGYALSPSMGTIRNDLGAYGGLEARLIGVINVEDIYLQSALNFGSVDSGISVSKKIELLNMGTYNLIIDSLRFSENIFTISEAMEGDTIKMLRNDTISINWTATVEGTNNDTLLVYHSYKSIENPKRVILTGNAIYPVDPEVSQINIIEKNAEMLSIFNNPCSESCIINYQVNTPSMVNLNLYDINGRKVYELNDSRKDAGSYQFEFYRGSLKDGIYILQYIANGSAISKKLLIN